MNGSRFAVSAYRVLHGLDRLIDFGYSCAGWWRRIVDGPETEQPLEVIGGWCRIGGHGEREAIAMVVDQLSTSRGRTTPRMSVRVKGAVSTQTPLFVTEPA